jgi:hypothetical protein
MRLYSDPGDDLTRRASSTRGSVSRGSCRARSSRHDSLQTGKIVACEYCSCGRKGKAACLQQERVDNDFQDYGLRGSGYPDFSLRTLDLLSATNADE